MNIYLVRNRKNRLYLDATTYRYVIEWVEQQEATIYKTWDEARDAGRHLYKWPPPTVADKKFEVVHFIATEVDLPC